MDTKIAENIADLPGLNKAELRSIWQTNFDQPAPPHLRKELLASILAYRIQEKAYGGLSPQARKRLREIAESLNTTSRKRKSTSLQPGTRLVRSWQGVLHQVTVLTSGYEYNGKSYGSLSVIAREITGTRWSGPLFFGTKRKKA
jgi:Protein of unknown function (DUF2924)